ncbi:MAG TPA: DUF1761 domain-containing protein [Gemmatimonadaceae bacterium]|nr:DUF1761 domain-containing protein [Gemmatimonadaceae bacterium]
MNYWAGTVSAVSAGIAFLASAIYDTALAPLRTRFSPAAAGEATRPGAAQMVAEILRNLVLALVSAYLVIHLGRTGWAHAIAPALLLWIGFPAILIEWFGPLRESAVATRRHSRWRLARGASARDDQHSDLALNGRASYHSRLSS